MKRIRNKEVIQLFGQHLRQLRQQKQLTMEDLSFESGVSYTQLGRIELGEINTTISTIFALAGGLQVNPKELFDFDFTPEPNSP